MSYDNVIPLRRATLPQFEAPTAVTQVSPAHKQKLDFDAQVYLPKDRMVPLRENSVGTHQIPHKIYEFMFKASGTKVELLVFACLIRFSMGYHRAGCKASLSFIAGWTGLAIPNARKGVEALLASGLVVRMELGSHFSRPSLYEIPVVKGYLEHLVKLPQTEKLSEKSECESVEKERAPLSNQLQYCDQINPGTVIDSITNKDIINKNLKKTLSPDPFLKNYFDSLQSKRKKESEWKHFEEIQNDGYSVQQISTCLELLAKEGIPQTNSDSAKVKIECHSPMAFLSTAIERVLAEATLRNEKIRAKEDREKRTTSDQEKKAQDSAREEIEFSEKVRLFEKAFPTQAEQQKHIDEFAKKNPIFSRAPSLLKNLAISAWPETTTSTNNST